MNSKKREMRWEEIMDFWKREDKEFYDYMKSVSDHDMQAMKAKEYEKAGEIEKAIALYEKNLLDLKDTDFFSVERLAIIYRNMGKIEDEIRVLEKSLKIIPHSKLKDRLEKAKALMAKRQGKA
jgi:tetratricopeptide (TPR) repeat protein